MVKHITLKRYAETSGVSVSAMKHYIGQGEWIEGVHYIYNPKGKIMVNLEGVELWQTQNYQRVSSRTKTASRFASQ